MSIPSTPHDMTEPRAAQTIVTEAGPSLEELPDRELMARAMQGNRAAYGILFRRHADGIWRMSYLLVHSAPAADDAVQETFTRGLARIETYRGEAEPQAWFYSIALNVCRHTLRDENSQAEPAEPETLERGRRLGPRPRGVLTSVLRRERSRRLALALGYLTPPQREVFVLHYVEDLAYEQVASLLDITPGAARALSHRARAVLRDKLAADVPLLSKS
ncbi:MAG: RNA polymerase sigma factor [Planctomycetes bacterium]|nr:RNA polymerase sigma factor [Planctomycetota bacterium]